MGGLLMRLTGLLCTTLRAARSLTACAFFSASAASGGM